MAMQRPHLFTSRFRLVALDGDSPFRLFGIGALSLSVQRRFALHPIIC